MECRSPDVQFDTTRWPWYRIRVPFSIARGECHLEESVEDCTESFGEIRCKMLLSR